MRLRHQCKFDFRKTINDMKRTSTLLFLSLLAFVLAGCVSEKGKPVLGRGWIGGDYVLARRNTAWMRLCSSPGVTGTLPKSLSDSQRAAIEITALATNTPAGMAGLQKGDLVLELNQKPVTSLRAFRHSIDRSTPGTLLAIKAYRNGQLAEYQVRVGREKYRNGGVFLIVAPTTVHRWDLWPNPGFSLVCVGFEPNPGLRHELGKTREVYDESWSAYLGFIELSHGKHVISQEPVIAGKAE